MTSHSHPSAAKAPAISSQDEELDLGQLLHTLWRGLPWIAICVALFVGAAGYYAYGMAVPKYTATAVVTLESRQEQVVDLTSVMTGLAGDQATINTEIEVIRSRGLVAKLVDRMNLVEDPEFNERLRPPSFGIRTVARRILGLFMADREAVEPDPIYVRDRVVESVMGVLNVANTRQSYVFKLTVVTTDARKSAAMANMLAELYIQEQLEVKFEATQKATLWLTERVTQLQIDLEAAEAAVEEFNSGTALINPEALAGLNRQVKDLRVRLEEAQEAVTAAQARLAGLKAAATGNDPAVMAEIAGDRTLTQLLNRLNTAGDGDRTAFDTRFQQVLSRAALELNRAQTQVTTLNTSVQTLSAQLEEQSADLVELQQLQREAAASRQIYEYFLTRLKETSVQQGVQQADSRILSEAVVPYRASAPRKMMILAVAILMGAVVGAAIVIIRELAQNTFRTAEELEGRTHTTVLGQVPTISAKRRKNVLKYLREKPTSAAVEAIRNMRTSVLLSNVDNPPQVLMTTSSIPGEGKTTLALALAHNLAGMNKKVLLMEGDIRRRTFSEYFHVEGKKGLLAVLSGEEKLEDVLLPNEELHADVLIGEKTNINAADVFSSERFHNFLVEMRKKYDYVVIDTPPVLAVPDARVIGQHVDAIMYTVKWDSTTHRQVAEGLRSFNSVNVHVTGVVLNQISQRGMKRYGYGDSYGSYNSYYDT